MNTVQSADGTTIAYDRSGQGEPLILIGGSFSERAHPTMTQLAEELAPTSLSSTTTAAAAGTAATLPSTPWNARSRTSRH